MQRRVEVEEGRSAVEEVVVAREEDVGGRGGVAGAGHGEFHRYPGHHGEELRVGRGEAGCVEERGECADLHGGGLRSGVVAGVVLGSSADGDVR